MNNYYTFNNQIVCKVGEVAVHNSVGVPEAHALFRANGKYLTMGINDYDNHMKPVESKAVVHLIDNQRKSEAVMDCMLLLFGPVEVWTTRSRHRSKVKARHLLFWALRYSTTMTLVEISAMILGNYDHATVIHGCKIIDQEIESGEHEITARAQEIASVLELLGCTRLQRRIEALSIRSIIAKGRMKRNREIIA
jgi:hypothetical protein